PTNATFPFTLSRVTIFDDDAVSNQLNYFTWGTISWPQRAGASFSASVTAKDYVGGTVTSFSGTSTVFAVSSAAATNNIIANKTHSFSDNLGNFTVGYSFTP